MYIPFFTISKLLQENTTESILIAVIIVLICIIIAQRKNTSRANKVNYQYKFVDEKPREIDDETLNHLFYLDSKQIEFIQLYSDLPPEDRIELKNNIKNELNLRDKI